LLFDKTGIKNLIVEPDSLQSITCSPSRTDKPFDVTLIPLLVASTRTPIDLKALIVAKTSWLKTTLLIIDVPLARDAEIIALCKNDFDAGGHIEPETLEG
jgi:hypothetical protein